MNHDEPKMKIGDKTLLSLHVVVMMIGMAIWIVRVSDKVDSHEVAINEFIRYQRDATERRLQNQLRMLTIEAKLGIRKKDD